MTKKILSVDDDPSVRRLVQSVLKTHGYEVISASDGLEALVKVKKELPDLIVLDVMMPEVNGYEVCFQLRFNKEFQEIPIILLTSRDEEIDTKLREQTNIEYLQKPLDTQLLIEKVHRMLSKESE